MFKIGDIVVPKDKATIAANFIHLVEKLEYRNEFMVVTPIIDRTTNKLNYLSTSHVWCEEWEYEKDYLRAKKLEKICSKLKIKNQNYLVN